MRCPLILLALPLIACATAEPPGQYWKITATGVDDGCTGSNVPYNETFTYRVVFDGNNIEVAVGEDVFATGTANGCNLNYESVVWSDTREDYEIDWLIRGAAIVNQGGGSACPLTNTDWAGVELFEVVSSEDPDIQPGCTYELELEGKWLYEVQ